jgi:hypothetical protein
MCGAEHIVVPLGLARSIFDPWVPDLGERFGMVAAMSVDEPDEPDAHLAAPSSSQARRRAYEAVQAVLSDDHNYESGIRCHPGGDARGPRGDRGSGPGRDDG